MPFQPRFNTIIFGVTLLAVTGAVSLWAASILRTPPHSDVLWLIEGLSRWLSGYSSATFIFEPNPPYNFFAYALPYFASKVTALDLGITLFFYIMILLALSGSMLAYALSAILKLSQPFWVLVVAAYALALTVMTTSVYAEREHIIAMVIVPFALLQWGVTQNIPLKKGAVWAFFVLGSLIVFMKPHHGLIPALMILHRIGVRRDLSAMKDPDFISLVLCGLTYITVNLFLFPDYIQIILPEVLSLYVTTVNADVFKQAAMLAIPCVLAIVAGFLLRKKYEAGQLVLFLGVGALCSLVPFIVQQKGFFYHLLPMFAFLIPAIALCVGWFMEKEIRFSKINAAALTTVMMVAGLLYIFRPNFDLPVHDDYMHMPLTKLVQAGCLSEADDCRFLMFSDSMGIVHETAYETGYLHASRFPSFWFLPSILSLETTDPDRARILKEDYAEMIAEDLETFKPQTILIARLDLTGKGVFSFPAYWSVSSAFQKAWSAYRSEGKIEISYGDYYPGTLAVADAPLVFDIYRRN